MRELLPTLTVPLKAGAHPRGWFGYDAHDVWLEIGFGGGEHLTAIAQANPQIGFIGCEGFENGVAKILHVIEEHRIGNIRLHPADALDLLPLLPSASIGRLYVLYPDPWPKVRQRKRRIISPAFIEHAARILKPGALFRFATDIDDYSAWTLARMLKSRDFVWLANSSDDWTKSWDGWTRTRYEAKALREDRNPAYLTFQRK